MFTYIAKEITERVNTVFVACLDNCPIPFIVALILLSLLLVTKMDSIYTLTSQKLALMLRSITHSISVEVTAAIEPDSVPDSHDEKPGTAGPRPGIPGEPDIPHPEVCRPNPAEADETHCVSASCIAEREELEKEKDDLVEENHGLRAEIERLKRQLQHRERSLMEVDFGRTTPAQTSSATRRETKTAKLRRIHIKKDDAKDVFAPTVTATVSSILSSAVSSSTPAPAPTSPFLSSPICSPALAAISRPSPAPASPSPAAVSSFVVSQISSPVPAAFVAPVETPATVPASPDSVEITQAVDAEAHAVAPASPISIASSSPPASPIANPHAVELPLSPPAADPIAPAIISPVVKPNSITDVYDEDDQEKAEEKTDDQDEGEKDDKSGNAEDDVDHNNDDDDEDDDDEDDDDEDDDDEDDDDEDDDDEDDDDEDDDDEDEDEQGPENGAGAIQMEKQQFVTAQPDRQFVLPAARSPPPVPSSHSSPMSMGSPSPKPESRAVHVSAPFAARYKAKELESLNLNPEKQPQEFAPVPGSPPTTQPIESGYEEEHMDVDKDSSCDEQEMDVDGEAAAPLFAGSDVDIYDASPSPSPRGNDEDMEMVFLPEPVQEAVDREVEMGFGHDSSPTLPSPPRPFSMPANAFQSPSPQRSSSPSLQLSPTSLPPSSPSLQVSPTSVVRSSPSLQLSPSSVMHSSPLAQPSPDSFALSSPAPLSPGREEEEAVREVMPSPPLRPLPRPAETMPPSVLALPRSGQEAGTVSEPSASSKQEEAEASDDDKTEGRTLRTAGS